MQRGVDYEPLRAALKEEDFLEADDIHRKKLIEVAGEEAQERGWVYYSEVRCLPCPSSGSDRAAAIAPCQCVLQRQHICHRGHMCRLNIARGGGAQLPTHMVALGSRQGYERFHSHTAKRTRCSICPSAGVICGL